MRKALPADISQAITVYMTAVTAYAKAPFGKRDVQLAHVGAAHADLEAAILHHLRNADEMKAALERIEAGT